MWWLASPDGCGPAVSDAPARTHPAVTDGVRSHSGRESSPRWPAVCKNHRPANPNAGSVSGDEFGGHAAAGEPLEKRLLIANDRLICPDDLKPKPIAAADSSRHAQPDSATDSAAWLALRRELQHLRTALTDAQANETRLRQQLAESNRRESAIVDREQTFENEADRVRQTITELREHRDLWRTKAQTSRFKHERSVRRHRQRTIQLRHREEDRRRLEERERRLTDALAEASKQRNQWTERANRFDVALRERIVREAHLARSHRANLAQMKERLRVGTLENDLRLRTFQQTQQRLALLNKQLLEDLNKAQESLRRYRRVEARAEGYRVLADDTARQAEADRTRWESTLAKQVASAEEQRNEHCRQIGKLSLRLVRATETAARRDSTVRFYSDALRTSETAQSLATQRLVVATRKRRQIRVTARNRFLIQTASIETPPTENANRASSHSEDQGELWESLNATLQIDSADREHEFFIDVTLAARDREQSDSLFTVRRDRDLQVVMNGDLRSQLRDLRLRHDLLRDAFGRLCDASGQSRQTVRRAQSQIHMLVKRLDQSRDRVTQLLNLQERENERWRTRANRWISEKASLQQLLSEAQNTSARSQSEAERWMQWGREMEKQSIASERERVAEIDALTQRMFGLESEGIRFAEHLRTLRRLIRVGRRNAARHVAELESEISRLEMRAAA